jgi:ankyrin repeat protein
MMLRHYASSLLSLSLAVVSATAPVTAASPPSLVEAVRSGDADNVRLLLKQKADVNQASVDGTTPLHYAVESDDKALVELLIKSGANVRATNRYGVPPLAIAAVNGNAGVMKMLLDAGADPNAGLSTDETPTMTAARTGDVDALKMLLSHGAQINTRDSKGQTALMWAAARNNAAAVRILLEFGADWHVRTEKKPQQTRGRGSDMSVFLSPQPTGFTAFLFAVRAGSLDAVKALLDAGADVNDALSDGETALVVAAANANWEVASLLLDRGADPNAAGAGWNALHQTVHSRRPNLGYTPGPVSAGSLDSIEVVKKLLARGVDVNARMTKNGMKDGQRNRVSRLGATAFFLAAKTTDLEVLKVLLEAGADVNIPSADGSTPLMVAAGLGMWYVGEDGGSLPGQEDEAFEVVKLCVEHGSDVNAVNKMGETPLHGAAFRGVNLIAQYLVDKGAKLDAKDMRGWTPLFIANGLSYGDVFKQQPQTAQLLQKLMTGRGLSTEGQVADGTECLDCVQTHPDQARAALERDVKMEAEFTAQEKKRSSAAQGTAVGQP